MIIKSLERFIVQENYKPDAVIIGWAILFLIWCLATPTPSSLVGFSVFFLILTICGAYLRFKYRSPEVSVRAYFLLS